MKLLTISELSDKLAISKKTIYHWVHAEKIPYFKAGKHLRFDYSKVLKHFENSKRNSPIVSTPKTATQECSLKIEQEMRGRRNLQTRRLE